MFCAHSFVRSTLQGARLNVWFAQGKIENIKDLHTDLVIAFDEVFVNATNNAIVKALTKKHCPVKYAVLFKINLEAESAKKATTWKRVRDGDGFVRGQVKLMLAATGTYTWTLFKRETELPADAVSKIDPLFERAWDLAGDSEARKAALAAHVAAIKPGERDTKEVTCQVCSTSFYVPATMEAGAITCNDCVKTSSSGGNATSDKVNKKAKSRAVNSAALKEKDNTEAYFAPKPYEVDVTHLRPIDERNVIGVATSIAAHMLFLNPRPTKSRCTGTQQLAALKQNKGSHSTGVFSHGAIVHGYAMLGPMKIIAEAGTDVANLRDLPRKVFDENQVATLVGFRTKTADKSPMPMFIEYFDGKARGLTVLGDPAATKWLENTQKASAWDYSTTSTTFDVAEIATIIALVTTDTGILQGMRINLVFVVHNWPLHMY